MRISRLNPVLLYALVLGLILCASVLHAQNDYLNRVNRPNFAVTEPVEMGFNNLANGTLHLDIPMATMPQRGGNPLTVKLTYDSRVYTPIYSPYYFLPTGWGWYPDNVHQSLSGWKVVLAGAADGIISDGCSAPFEVCAGVNNSFSQGTCDGAPGTNPGNYMLWSNWTWESADGESKTFGITTSIADDIGGNCNYYQRPSDSQLANDGSGFKMVVTNYTDAVVYDNAGNQVYPTVEDSNGNYTGFDTNVNVIDQLSRTPVVKTVNGNVTYYDILNSQGTRSRFTVTYTTINVNTAFGRPYTAEYSGTLNVVQSLTLPNGTSYSFGYDSGTAPGNYGLLTNMTLPTGGQIQFGYSNFIDSTGNLNKYGRWLTSRNSLGNIWTYVPQVTGNNTQQVTVTRPNGESTVYSFNVPWNTNTIYRDASGNTVKTESKDYVPPLTVGNLGSRFLGRLTTSVPTSGGSLTKKVEYSYDAIVNNNVLYGNVSEVREWDYYTGAPPSTPTRITDATYTAANPTYLAKNILNKPASIVVKDGSGNVAAQTVYEYDNYTEGISASGAVQHDAGFGTGYGTRGNVTAVERWRNTDGAWLTTRNQYDDAGNLVKITDPNSNPTYFSYADSWGEASCAPSGGNAAAYISSITNALGHVARKTYNSCTGTLALSTDPNNRTTSYAYNDSMGRLTSVIGPPDPNNGNQQPQTTFGYVDTPSYNSPVTYRQDKIDANNQTTSWTLIDGVGRVIRTAKFNGETDVNRWVDDVDTCYDSLGRKQYETYPYQGPGWGQPGTYHCPSDPATPAGDSFAYDALGRLTVVTHADGTIVSTDYSQFPKITASDEAGHARQSQSDALGRLIKVWEPDPATGTTFPNETDYQYDALDNLIHVQQQGGVSDSSQWRTRTFQYDSLSRLLTATNPESGTICYGQWQSGQCVNGYDGNGNLLYKTSPAPNQTSGASLQTTFYYDALNRLTAKCFSDSTPCESLYYDAASIWGLTMHNPIGRLVATGVSSNNANTLTSYDVMGRPEWQVELRLGAPLKTFNYAYNVDGSLKTITYPSGRVVNYNYNIGQRPVSAVDSANNINFATGVHYTAAGALSSVVNGNTSSFAGITTTNSYNIRMQPYELKTTAGGAPVLDLTYDFGLGQFDNGNVSWIINNKDSSRTQQFGYDALNRLLSAYTPNLNSGGYHNWWQGFSYDIWGNLLARNVAGGDTPLNVTVNGNNQATNWCYDAAGNVVGPNNPCSTYANNHTAYENVFDAENRLTQTTTGAGTTSYGYDAVGQRVKKSNGSTGTLYWQGAGGEVLEETDLNGNLQNDTSSSWASGLRATT